MGRPKVDKETKVLSWKFEVPFISLFNRVFDEAPETSKSEFLRRLVRDEAKRRGIKIKE